MWNFPKIRIWFVFPFSKGRNSVVRVHHGSLNRLENSGSNEIINTLHACGFYAPVVPLLSSTEIWKCFLLELAYDESYLLWVESLSRPYDAAKLSEMRDLVIVFLHFNNVITAVKIRQTNFLVGIGLKIVRMFDFS